MANETYIQPYLDTLAELDAEDDFVRSESEDGVHIYYKLKDDLYDASASIRYEFLFEFDKEDFGYGIYYGCKCIFLTGQEEELRACVDREWEALRSGVTRILNNTCPGKDFLRRARPMASPINGHYWPFWIRLVDDESIVEIGQKVLRDGIRFIYETRLVGNPGPCNLPFAEKVRRLREQHEHIIPRGIPEEERDRQYRELLQDMEDEWRETGADATPVAEVSTEAPWDLSVINDEICIPDPAGPRRSIRVRLDKERVAEEFRTLAREAGMHPRYLRALYELTCENADNRYKILRGSGDPGKRRKLRQFVIQVLGITGEKEVRRLSDSISGSEGWTSRTSEIERKVRGLVESRLILRP